MMNVKNIQNSPFYAVEVGSTIVNGQHGFSASILNTPITKFNMDVEQSVHMSGESSYIYADQLNQGSIGVSGSYGTSGVSKFEAGISAYAGKSTASTTKSIDLDYYIQILSGVEYINFPDLNVMDIVNSLMSGPKKMLLDSLSAYTEVQEYVRENQIDLLKALAEIKKFPKLEELFTNWLKSVNTFHKNYGDGVVVGIIWGGIGQVKLKIESNSSENKWKYGGASKFSYAGVDKSVSIAAAYDGANSNRNSKVNTTLSSYAIGEVVQEQVNKWTAQLSNKAFDEICNISLLNSAPPLDKKPDIPAIPEFIKPQKEKKVTDLFDKIGSLDNLEAYAKAAAYEEKKKNGDATTLEEFLKKTSEPANIDNIKRVKNSAENNDINTQHTTPTTKKATDNKALNNPSENQIKKANGLSVLGTWIVNWADLFPWLATGYYNQIDDISDINHTLQKQVMLQDFIALRNLYRLFSNSGINAADVGIINFEILSKRFDDALEYLTSNFDHDDATELSLNHLDKDAKAIYTYWNENSFLRFAELGLGISLNNKFAIAKTIEKVDKVNDKHLNLIYRTYKCEINNPSDYSLFKDSITGIPLITPKGKVYLIGQNNMFLSAVTKDSGTFTRDASKALVFVANKEGRLLKNNGSQTEAVYLYPIQFQHAKNLNWSGRIISNNIASNKQIMDKIGLLKNELSRLNTYSFSSDFFTKGSSWSPETCYSPQSLKTQYYGLIPSVGNIF